MFEKGQNRKVPIITGPVVGAVHNRAQSAGGDVCTLAGAVFDVGGVNVLVAVVNNSISAGDGVMSRWASKAVESLPAIDGPVALPLANGDAVSFEPGGQAVAPLSADTIDAHAVPVDAPDASAAAPDPRHNTNVFEPAPDALAEAPPAAPEAAEATDSAATQQGPFRLLCASPSSGKSTLAREGEVLQGAFVIDTDTIVRVLRPDWFDDKLWRTASDDARAELSRTVGEAAARLLTTTNCLIISNLHDKHFVEQLPSSVLVDGKVPLRLMRTNAETVVRLFEERGDDPLPVELARSWFNPERLTGARDHAAHVIDLDAEGQTRFVGDVVTVTAEGFFLK